MICSTNFLTKSLNFCKNNVRQMCSVNKQYQEITIPVPWGYLRGKWWGPTDSRPILTIHGWQDNCGTFNRLIPLLNKNVGFLAIDLPGHGYSSRLPPGMYYHFTNYLILINYVKNYFEWPKVSLLGHSLGGITSYVYRMLYPNNVDFSIHIDGAKPMIRPRNNVYVAYALEKFLKNMQFAEDSQEPPSYTIEQVKKKIAAPNENSVAYEHAHHIMDRNIAPSKLHPGKYYFTRDPRLKLGALLNFSQNELVEYAQNMKSPIFIAKAKKGSYYEVKENFYEVLDVLKRSSEDCDFHYIEGTHHAHLNNPEEVGLLIKKFIQKHNIEDRSVGGIKEGMILTETRETVVGQS